MEGAEYEHKYQREQQKSEFGLQYWKNEADRMGEMYLNKNSECVHLKAERTELRSMVEDAIGVLRINKCDNMANDLEERLKLP